MRPSKTSAILHSANYANKKGEAVGEPIVFVRIIPGIMYLGAGLPGQRERCRLVPQQDPIRRSYVR
jgi:hypothetical protein